jgi:hypothetical protein
VRACRRHPHVVCSFDDIYYAIQTIRL